MVKRVLLFILYGMIYATIFYGQEEAVKKEPPKTKGSSGNISWEVLDPSTTSPGILKKAEQFPGLTIVPIRLEIKESPGTEQALESEGVTQLQSLTTIMSDNFESAFPGSKWQVSGDPTWGKTDYKKHAGTYSVWCARSGSSGVDPRYYNYPNNCNSWMKYGSFSLSGVNWAGFSFWLWLESESNYDYFIFGASTNGTTFYAYRISGSSGGSWIPFGLALTDVPTLGNVTGRSSVWIGFGFTSDGSSTYKGAFVDDVTLEKGNVGTFTQSGNPFSTPGTFPFGLASDGTYLWHTDVDYTRLYKLNPTTGTVVNNYSVGGSPSGLAWDGTNLWMADASYDRIYKMSSTGSKLTSFSTPGSIPTGLTWDGNNFWLCDQGVSTIWKLSPSGTIISSFSAPGTLHNGLGWDGQKLWLTDGELELIYVLDPAGNVVNHYLPLSNFPTDLEWSGSQGWIADDHTNKIYRVNSPVPPENPVAIFTVSPNSGGLTTVFQVDASSSYDDSTASSELQVRWDWENDGTYDTEYTTTKTASHQYSTFGTKTIKLEVIDTDQKAGTTTQSVLVENLAPTSFSLISPTAGDTVRSFTPTFVWRSSTDPDPTDSVRYRVYISTSRYFYSTQTDTLMAGVDTTATLTDSLTEVQWYYWKVEAYDQWPSPWTKVTTSTAAPWSFYVPDLTPPSFLIALLQNPIMTEDLDIYVVPSEPLDTKGLQLTANGTLVKMDLLDTYYRIYTGDYELSSSGTLVLITKGTDRSKNEGIDTLSVPVQLIKPTSGGAIASLDKRIQVTFPKDAVSQEAYVLILPLENSQGAKVLFKDFPNEPEGMEAIGPVYQIGPAQLSLVNSALLTFSYGDGELNGRDESKLGIYVREGSNWVYLGSYVDEMANTITTQVNRLGEYRLLWNPGRVESAMPVPKEYHLSQNYPNPFNSRTVIRYSIPQPVSSRVILKIYNFNGQTVRTLVDKFQGMGYYNVGWDGTDDRGNEVASGVYFYQLQTERFRATNKMILLR
ncbi:MAG: T9SS type A sorting domain-containing protein [candidate division KSB1 bacterium]|nr:T9SS type A sorting domain-containing protein [candidate division KSB1 bacterium]